MSSLRWFFTRKLTGNSTCKRLIHTTPYRAHSPRQENTVPAEWLQRILKDRSEPPKLYAWSPANLPGIVTATSTAPPAAGATRGKDSAEDEQRRIYILGVGNMGCLYAMCLARRAPRFRAPITLVVHRRELLEHWAAHPGIELAHQDQHRRKDQRRGRDRDREATVEKNAGFDVEWWTEARPDAGPVAEIAGANTIPSLIVATKAADALPQVDRLRRYLGPQSTIAFTQNGMCKLWPPLGEAYVRARFPESESRSEGEGQGASAGGGGPNWLACVTTHGVTSLGPFRSLHASPANAFVGPVLVRDMEAEYLMEQIASAPGLGCRPLMRRELWVAQLEKLVVNSVINPLTAVLRCKNGELFARRDGEDDLVPVVDALVDEASRTLSALVADPSSDAIVAADGAGNAGREQLLEQFSFARLRKMLLAVGDKVAENTSSMLQDVSAGKQTEIDDFNGWLVETARSLDEGLRLPLHERLIGLVKAEAVLTRSEVKRHLMPTEIGRQ